MDTGTVDVIIPVYRPGEEFLTLLWMLKKQTVPVRRVIVMITEAQDVSYPDFSSFGFVEVHSLLPEEFDHGATRNLGASFSDADHLLFMTQDAEPVNNYLVENLLHAFSDPETAAAYARQIPRKNAGVIESYTRGFSYPCRSRIQSKELLQELGIRTYFCSNVCAMYDGNYFRASGGFTHPTIFNEDMIYAFHAIEDGKKIAYRADAEVRHSHHYSGIRQFRRNFDLAVSQADHPEIFRKVSSKKEGISLVKKTAGYLLRSGRFWLLPELVIQSGMKYLGYRYGKNYRKHRRSVNRFCSMNRNYWEENKENGTDQSNTL